MFQRNLLRASQRAVRSSASRPSSLSIRPQTLLNRAARPQSVSSVRWYSEEAAKKEETAPKEGANGTEDAAKLKEELEKKDKEIVDLKDKYLRSVADFRNLQIQTKREVQAAKDYALQKFARDLVESVDNLDRALTTVPPEKLIPENTDLVAFHEGVQMTENILMQTLKKHGLERFDPSVEGMKFDPNIHEAVFQTPQPDKEEGTVFYTQQKGFKLNGRVLRAAKVGVVKNS
ncbi:GrpE-domain-containing protein [Delitschia confertaspora ATCC 74209]|uniref:GrpE protein homolog n=1 Tax=Delitschia confertaspora ATCC 74209 TaxID=1513339 RepID=A0A9P4JK03_9PLEO|nr:GrpE-domain-containing protein [Delitschia confertaspora ATCC 74209]